ncbi:cold-shock protein [Salmonella enterica subsp. enterica serovar Muenchen]|nr:cold-shock protein [Salmonella enterica subsp. enterica serovar Muenchen]
MPHNMTGIVKNVDILRGKGLIILSDGRKDVLHYISAVNSYEPELLIPGSRIEFCRISGLRGTVAANIYLQCLKIKRLKLNHM